MNIYAFYINVNVCIYYIVLKKLNILQIYLCNINIYFEFRFRDAGFKSNLIIFIFYFLSI